MTEPTLSALHDQLIRHRRAGWLLGGVVAVLAVDAVRKPDVISMDYSTGRILAVKPLGDALIPDSTVLSLVVDCVIHARRFSAENYRAVTHSTADCFSDDGWTQFRWAVEPTLRLVQEFDLPTYAVAGPAFIEDSSRESGLRTWSIVLPIRIAFAHASGRSLPAQSVRVHMRVARSAATDWGHAITSYYEEPQP